MTIAQTPHGNDSPHETKRLLWTLMMIHRNRTGERLSFRRLVHEQDYLDKVLEGAQTSGFDDLKEAAGKVRKLDENALRCLSLEDNHRTGGDEPASEETVMAPEAGGLQEFGLGVQDFQEEYRKMLEDFLLDEDSLTLVERMELDRFAREYNIKPSDADRVEAEVRTKQGLAERDWIREYELNLGYLLKRYPQGIPSTKSAALQKTYAAFGRVPGIGENEARLRVPIQGQINTQQQKRNTVTKVPPIGWATALLVFLLVTMGGAGVYLSLRGYSSLAAAPEPAPVAAAPRIRLRLHGSDTLGSELVPALAEAFLRAKGAPEVERARGELEASLVVQSKPSGQAPSDAIEIQGLGSATGFADLAAGTADISMASRPVNPTEAARLARFGDFTSPACEHILALDGLSVAVNRKNRLDTLSKAQVAEIFSGALTDWSKLGGTPGGINLYVRDDRSGTYDTFVQTVLDGKPVATSARRLASNAAISESVARDPLGIGFVGLPYVKDGKALAIGEGSMAVPPTPFHVATEDYALSRRLYLYIPTNPTNPWVRDFTEFALSPAAQPVITKLGFVSLDLQMAASPAKPEKASRYAELTRGAQRLSLSFRDLAQQDGKFLLSDRGQKDLDRVVKYLAQHRAQAKRVILLGFSDNADSYDINKEMSLRRAQAIEKALVTRGITPVVVEGLGGEYPVASDSNQDGREKNRRVEIWVM
ncbi:phosphate transport system substrate-binding protein [Gammaproteobacteria bacterium]